MSSFSNSHFDKKIKMLTMSQQSIQTLSLWCIHHRKHAKSIVQTWYKDLQKAKVKKKLALMYLANDILQNSRKKGQEFNKEFANILPGAVNHCRENGDDKLKDALSRIFAIWTERSVYDKRFINFLGQSSDEESTTPPLESMPIDESGFETHEIRPPDNPPDPDDLVRRLQELENSATQDAMVREQIANLPTEVTDPTYIDKVEDLAAARRLQEKINNACELLAEYNSRLAAEQVDREVAHRMLTDYTTMQKYQLSSTETKIEEYETKLEKVKAVKQELQSHLENLPDLTKLPNPVPLPSAGDLFASSRK